MTVPVRVLPAYSDTERAVCDVLAGITATGTETPVALQSEASYLRVTRTGGADDGITDTADVSVDAFAPDADTAKAVAEQARQLLLGGLPASTPHGTVDQARIAVWTGMTPASDTDNLRLCAASYTVTMRRSRLCRPPPRSGPWSPRGPPTS